MQLFQVRHTCTSLHRLTSLVCFASCFRAASRSSLVKTASLFLEADFEQKRIITMKYGKKPCLLLLTVQIGRGSGP